MLNWKLEGTYLGLPEALYALVETAPAPAPKAVVFNRALAAELGLGGPEGAPPAEGQLAPEAHLAPADLDILSGRQVPPGARVFAQAYAGHQYGHFTRLGDGRAAVLGELVSPGGQRFDLQLKGSGPTPFARRGDGKAVLGPMLREHLIGEYLHGVGLRTSRALAVVTTGEPVWREGWRPGAVLARVAASHLRVGTFEFAGAFTDRATLQALADYALARHYPECAQAEQPYRAFCEAVGRAQFRLVGRWMALGFVHGVMNTDNVAISGQALDFGPCAFLDRFAFDQTFSSIDRHGRYAWGQQMHIALWNQARFTEALLPLLGPDPEAALAWAQGSLEALADEARALQHAELARKLGLSHYRSGDEALVQGCLSHLEEAGADFAGPFAALTAWVGPAAGSGTSPGGPAPSPGVPFDPAWLNRWQARLADETEPLSLMQAANPPLLPRNRPVQAALDAAEAGDLGPYRRLAQALSAPFDPASALLAPELRAEAAPEPAENDREPFVTFCGT